MSNYQRLILLSTVLFCSTVFAQGDGSLFYNAGVSLAGKAFGNDIDNRANPGMVHLIDIGLAKKDKIGFLFSLRHEYLNFKEIAEEVENTRESNLRFEETGTRWNSTSLFFGGNGELQLYKWLAVDVRLQFGIARNETPEITSKRIDLNPANSDPISFQTFESATSYDLAAAIGGGFSFKITKELYFNLIAQYLNSTSEYTVDILDGEGNKITEAEVKYRFNSLGLMGGIGIHF